ncbi:group XIIB secretory phospholipase A2-like protein isoform X2 [Halichoeres trimaculatus]|uniref:group XIIB secretory phospholipase A2-like protein isoform X2 n=1 Tax=Halichoeres trimaculatus TaxID=147232 RepID=UPI003D9F1B51
MLLRTTLLLLLCASVAMSATLGHYQAQAQEEEEEKEAQAVTGDAVGDVDAGVDSVAVQADDPPAAEEPEGNSLVGDDLATQAQDVQEADKPEVDAPGTGAPTVEEPEAGSDGPAGGAPEEAVTQEQPASDAAISHDQPPPSDEAVDLVKPSHEEEEEDNEIKPVPTEQSQSRKQEESSSWSLNSIRNSFQTMHGYFDSLVELVGGQNGVCQYRCRYGETPQPRPGYQLPEPNGCSSSLVGFELDLGIPAMTNCCNELDMCYDTCGMSKYDCDSKFRSCLHSICSDVNKSLGFVKKVEACESMADTLFNTVWTLGCRPYMNSQRAACVCAEEERDEL